MNRGIELILSVLIGAAIMWAVVSFVPGGSSLFALIVVVGFLWLASR